MTIVGNGSYMNCNLEVIIRYCNLENIEGFPQDNMNDKQVYISLKCDCRIC